MDDKKFYNNIINSIKNEKPLDNIDMYDFYLIDIIKKNKITPTNDEFSLLINNNILSEPIKKLISNLYNKKPEPIKIINFYKKEEEKEKKFFLFFFLKKYFIFKMSELDKFYEKVLNTIINEQSIDEENETKFLSYLQNGNIIPDKAEKQVLLEYAPYEFKKKLLIIFNNEEFFYSLKIIFIFKNF
jgi:hypothetical protein